jgi:hypothetical protein
MRVEITLALVKITVVSVVNAFWHVKITMRVEHSACINYTRACHYHSREYYIYTHTCHITLV